MSRWRSERVVLPLVLRALVLAFSGLLTFLPRQGLAVVPAMLLLVIAAVGSYPVTHRGVRAAQHLFEALAAAVVVGAFPGLAGFFVPYLLIPVGFAGYEAGILIGTVGGASTVGVLLVSQFLAKITGADAATTASAAAACGDAWQCAGQVIGLDGAASGTSVVWVPVIVGVGTVAGWFRRLRASDTEPQDLAYADAHRLLTELQHLSSRLDSGLDTATLARNLAADLRGVNPDMSVSLCVRSSSGRFVTLAGSAVPDARQPILEQAWQTALPQRAELVNGRVEHLEPLRMGTAVVAVACLRTLGELDPEALRRSRMLTVEAAPRLASALVFEDVRRLATDDERLRLAREIHDGIAQDLASVGYLIDDIAIDAEPEVASRLKGLRDHVRTLVSELRLSIFDLRTGVDDDKGLAGSLAEYVQRVGTQAGLEVHVSTEESSSRLPSAVETEVLRIAQEAMTNVRKHARAGTVWLQAKVGPQYVHVTLMDDGRGLQRPRPDSVGITGMRERAERIGARVRVENRPDAPGTMVTITFGSRPPTTGSLDMADSPAWVAAASRPSGPGHGVVTPGDGTVATAGDGGGMGRLAPQDLAGGGS